MDRIVLVTKPTRLDELIRRHLTLGAASFALETSGQSILPYQGEDERHRQALDAIRGQLPPEIPVVHASREDVPRFLFRETDVVIACGPDGLFVNTAKYLANQLILGVNPDPNTIEGALMRFLPAHIGDTIARIRKGTHRTERLPLAKATVDGERAVWALGDLFIGRADHVSARYSLTVDRRTERQSSSGIVISTGIGSTGWIKSICAMAAGLNRGSAPVALRSFPHATDAELLFVVREPFPTASTGATIVTGRITPGSPLVLTSEMPEGGCVFSDGITEKTVPWPAGTAIEVSVGDRCVTRVVP